MLVELSTYFLSALFLSYCLTYGATKWLGSVGFLDIPNDRSMHQDTTPTSGGIAIGLSCWSIVFISQLELQFFYPWLIACTAFLVIGAADDHRSKGVLTRLLLQFWIALILAGWIVSSLLVGKEQHSLPNLLSMLSVFIVLSVSLVGAVNLFNFMDGADGFAASQSGIYFLVHGYLFATIGEIELTYLALILSGALGGFLFFNWQPAKLFMGDSGSYFLGSLCVAFSYFSWECGIGVSPSLILAAPFICDSVLTLISRFFAGDSWWQGHRSHCYQILLRRGISARQLVFALVALHAFCTFPLLFFSIAFPHWSSYCVLLSFGVIGFICYYLRQSYIRII